MSGLLKFITCGSVDDGKSTLIGHILYDSKLLYADQEKALLLDSKVGSRGGEIDYSLLLDGLMAEREQGITIDVAYRYFTTERRSFIVADTPGHEEYTRNMAVGASFADLAVILVDAKQGVLVQTKRHARICSLMGIRYFVFAVNKMDLVGYDEARFGEITAQIEALSKELGLSHVQIIPVSATEGDNVTTHSDNMPWYQGEALLPYLEEVDIRAEHVEQGFYLPVQRVCRPDHTFRGFQGQIEAGSVHVGDELVTLPSNEHAHVKSILIGDKSADEATLGQPVTIQLDKEVDVSRGCVLTSGSDLVLSNAFTATLLWMDDQVLVAGRDYLLKLGTRLLPAQVKRIRHKIDVNTGEQQKAAQITKNEIAVCDITLSEQIVLDEFKKHKTLGELILIDRITNMTSACGVVTQAHTQERTKQSMRFNTALLHDGVNREEANGATLTPIYQSSAFHHQTANELAKIFDNKAFGYSYTRVSNPTVEAFEARMTKLEHGLTSIACASGMAALSNALLNILQSGDELVASASLYGGSIDLFHDIEAFGITAHRVKNNDLAAFEAAINEHTKLIFAETIGNPTLDVTDLAALAELAHRYGIPLIVDNTVTSAYLLRPIDLGADIVINSTSKYINGSSNAISGVLTDSGKFKWDYDKYPQLLPYKKFGPYAYTAKLRNGLFRNTGACLAPQTAFYNMLGLETLGLRMERECDNAYALAKWLSKEYPNIIVNYPGLETSPWHELAKRQLGDRYGALLTLRVGSREKAFAFIDALTLPYKLSNIGDTKTLVIHPASTIALHNTPEELAAAGVTDDLIRVSVGIEDIEDLQEDFAQALSTIL